MTDMEILGAAIAYTNKCIAGAGGLKGANCTIKSIDPITGGNRITFEWEDNEGNIETSTMDVMDGAPGADGADGQDGVSPTISVSTITGGHAVSITDAQGTNTFNVMDGIDGANGSDGKDGKDGTNGTNGTDGVGITSITFKGTDASGNNIYTVNLSNSTSYDITCPKGPAGATGSTGPAGPGVASGGTTGQVLKKKSGTDYDTEWADESGGGHTIVNGAGTSMTQRDALQFTGGLAVSDDSTNERTVVSDDYELITWTDWQTIVANHEEDLHPNAVITGVPDADGDISVDLMTKLWENPSPSAAFAEQDILLDLTSFDMVYIQGSDSSCIVSKGISNRLQRVENADATSTSTGTLGIWRSVYVTDSYVSFGDCKSVFTTRAVYTSNNYCRPYQIYGIKTTASVKVSAIAENVSTSADKCMLSDGVTSVEDKIGNILFVEKSISNKSISTAWGSMFIAYDTVDISSLGISNAPDVISVAFGTTDAKIALCSAANINRNSINIALIRAESGTVNGKIMIMLKSNG